MDNNNEFAQAELQAVPGFAMTVPDQFIAAIKGAQEVTAAHAAVQEAMETPSAVVMLPEQFKLHDLERFQQLRRRARGVMTTRLIGHFADYCQQHATTGATVFVDPETMTASGLLNLGTPDAPGHADDLARLVPVRTAAFTDLQRIASRQNSQVEVAEWLEDWPEHIKCFNAEGEISAPKAIAAVRKITIEAMRKQETAEQQLSAQRSAFESVAATSSDPLPTTIHFSCQPYADLRERTFVLRLGILTGDGKPRLTLRVQRAEQHNEEMAEELSAKIAAEFAAQPVPVLLGTYKRGE